jgi:hypothetical protein
MGEREEVMGIKEEREIETGLNVARDLWCVVWQLRISRPYINKS